MVYTVNQGNHYRRETTWIWRILASGIELSSIQHIYAGKTLIKNLIRKKLENEEKNMLLVTLRIYDFLISLGKEKTYSRGPALELKKTFKKNHGLTCEWVYLQRNTVHSICRGSYSGRFYSSCEKQKSVWICNKISSTLTFKVMSKI